MGDRNRSQRDVGQAHRAERGSGTEPPRGQGEKARHFSEFLHQAGSWEQPRRVVAKAEIIPSHERDMSQRFVVTNRTDLSAEDEYDYYIERGDAECGIDELKKGCFCDPTSCSRLAANSFRLMLSMAAYLLLVLLRERAGAEDLRRAQAATLRLWLIKLGARITETADYEALACKQLPTGARLDPLGRRPRGGDRLSSARTAQDLDQAAHARHLSLNSPPRTQWPRNRCPSSQHCTSRPS